MDMCPENRESIIAIGVSACLLGENVRYDGGRKLDRYITEVLGRFCRLLPVCPEVESGMTVPREAMRLEGDPASPRLVAIGSRIDRTEQMLSFCRRRVRELEGEGLSGFIFKARSPSSGLRRVTVHSAGGRSGSGSGLFAAAMVRHFPLLPVAEEEDLAGPASRENFIERVCAFARWQEFRQSGGGLGELEAFHRRHKLQLMAHSTLLYRELGGVVARGREQVWPDLVQHYGALFMKALALHATVSKQCNVLQHIAGYFKKVLGPADKRELLEAIEQYRHNLVPLVVPLTLLKHHVALCGQQYLAQQHYLSPHPAELMLRNHG